jgi:hypothetical protein
MNERIRELAARAGVLADFGEDIKVGRWGIGGSYQSMEKLAELIVRECINEIAYIGKANEVFGDRTDRGGLNHILWTTETAIEKIKKHFGVDQ